MNLKNVFKYSLLASVLNVSIVAGISPAAALVDDCGQSACENSWLGLTEQQKQDVFAFGTDYKAFMDQARTEITGVAEAVKQAQAKGFKAYNLGDDVAVGGAYYYVNRDRSVVLFRVGEKPLREGGRVTASHIDSPRLELKGRPLYEREGFALFQTNYHGGLKRYQWESLPLGLVGHVDKRDGTRVDIRVGFDESDPIFIIPGLSPHVDGTLRNRKNRDVLAAEEMDPVIASMPEGDKKISDVVMGYLTATYGFEKADFVSAELAIVPALKPRDIGFDRALTGANGQDDRLASFSTLRAIIDFDGTPEYTSMVHLVDNEETGNNNNTGASSNDFFDFFEAVLYAQEGDDYATPVLNAALRKTKVISIDVNPGINPLWPGVWEKGNAPKLGYGVNLKLYGRGFNANSEFIAWTRKTLDDAGVPWQTATYKVGGGGGGTVGREYARRNMEVIDFGVPLFSIHNTYAVSSKVDVWNLYRATKAFFAAD